VIPAGSSIVHEAAEGKGSTAGSQRSLIAYNH
jgi:hypothetical protein